MSELPPDLTARLTSAGLDPAYVEAVLRTAYAEDLSAGSDVTTTATIPATAVGRAEMVARSPGVMAGLDIAEAAFISVGGFDGSAARVQRAADPIVPADDQPAASLTLTCIQHVEDGEHVSKNQTLMTVQGPLQAILTAERTALNLICHMSGIATLTASWVAEVSGTGARIRDTRKTLPGLRALQKYAVRCGGGVNHRMSLSDAALIKDNHVAAAGSVAAAFDAVRKVAPGLAIEVECDTLDQVREAVDAGAGLILLDNFSPGQMRAAVELVGGRAWVEASGGLRLDVAAQVAATGVDFLSVGALTHSAPALDIGLDLVEAG